MDISAARPHVVIIGGYLTEPLFYRPMRARLLARGAERVSVAPLHLPDWLAAALIGFGPASLRGARTIREARRGSAHPVLVVGHSAGGIVARLAMSTLPLDGRRAAVAADVACLVTLGTPHTLLQHLPWWEHQGIRATRFLERTSPGAWFAPSTSYLTVGSRRVGPSLAGPAAPTDPTPRVRPLGRILRAVFSMIVGPHPEGGGDGLVPDALARLEGAPHIALPDVLHGVFGAPWYGDDGVMDLWWPAALERWREALAVRRGRAGSAPAGPSVRPP